MFRGRDVRGRPSGVVAWLVGKVVRAFGGLSCDDRVTIRARSVIERLVAGASL
jgi:hypothetical protein